MTTGDRGGLGLVVDALVPLQRLLVGKGGVALRTHERTLLLVHSPNVRLQVRRTAEALVAVGLRTDDALVLVRLHVRTQAAATAEALVAALRVLAAQRMRLSHVPLTLRETAEAAAALETRVQLVVRLHMPVERGLAHKAELTTSMTAGERLQPRVHKHVLTQLVTLVERRRAVDAVADVWQLPFVGA